MRTHPNEQNTIKVEQQVDIQTASYRVIHDTPGHVTYGVWVNGGKSGELVLRQSERVAFQQMMARANIEFRTIA